MRRIESTGPASGLGAFARSAKLGNVATMTALAVAAAAFAPAGVAHAQAAPTTSTWELQGNDSQLSANLPDGRAVSLRASWALAGGDNLQAELMQERKFGDVGGIAALAYTRVFSDDWFGTGTFVYGHGGRNWADLKLDLQMSRKWLESRQLVTSVAIYRALYDAGRNDSGYRLSAAWYATLPVVWEAGVTLNTSQPGGIHSQMPYVAVTMGREKDQYLSLRYNRGSEAYQAVGREAQLVGFRSRGVTASWRRWLGTDWGVTALAEHYHNPSYVRRTLGVGVFAQW
jgi:YaiO family outer membrane protein